MRVLLLTYPLTPVSAAACGGTEQVAWLLLRHCSQQPHLSVTWIGAPDSQLWPGIRFVSWNQVLGEPWVPHPAATTAAKWNDLLNAFISRTRWDLVHNLGALSFAPATRVPVLFSLHLPRALYPENVIAQTGCHFHCVSRTQHALWGERACCGYIPNGIDLRAFPARTRPAPPSAPLLYLGRICPEKAPHAAIAAARQAGRTLWLVGSVAPFPTHQRYFRDSILPELDAAIHWLPPPPFLQKRALIAAAAAVVIPSQIAETSSITAMEAAASGVPVLATGSGALPEIVAHGETGWLGPCVDWPAWFSRLSEINPAACRRRADLLFRAERMSNAYTSLYARLASGRVH